MDHQDWKPVILRKNTKPVKSTEKVRKKFNENQHLKKLEGDDVKLEYIGIEIVGNPGKQIGSVDEKGDRLKFNDQGKSICERFILKKNRVMLLGSH